MSTHATFVVAWKVLTTLPVQSATAIATFLGPVTNVNLANTASAHSLCAEDLTTTPVLPKRGRILLCLLSWLQQNLFLINRVYMCCLYSVDFSFSQDDCDTTLWLSKQALRY